VDGDGHDARVELTAEGAFEADLDPRGGYAR
jgi:hypothetical protein